MIFRPCNGECTEEGPYCEGCGRSREEVDELRRLIGTLAAYATEMDYENVDDFADGVANGIRYAMSEGH